MTDSRSLSQRAKELAFSWHTGQQRKYTGAPYSDHLEAVAEGVRAVTSDETIVAAAYLHDILEDTKVPLVEVLNETSADVLALVVELTDVYTKERYPEWNRHARKEREAERLSTISGRAKIIKVSDILDNARDIKTHDPKFAKVYLRECRYTLKCMFPKATKIDLDVWLPT